MGTYVKEADDIRKLIQHANATGNPLVGEPLNVLQSAANKLESLTMDKDELVAEIVKLKQYCTQLENGNG
jgi:hypothetical protein